MTQRKRPPIRPDWLSKTLAGAVLGFTLAVAISGLFVQLNPTMQFNIKGQLAMWLLAPVWLTTLACSYFFGSGKRAWLWLIAANLLACAAFALARG